MKSTNRFGGIGILIACTMLTLAGITAWGFGTSDSTVRSINGHDIAYTTTNRPTNMSVGEIGFNLTTGRVETANGSTMNNITDVADSTTAGTAGLANTLISGSGAPGTGTTAGAAGGSVTVKSGAGGAKTTTGAAAGGAAGSVLVTGANGGATASAGTDAGGAGAAITITGGTGGAATAGTGNGGAGGHVTLTPGAGGATTGGTAGLIGSVDVLGPLTVPPSATAQTVAGSGTITLPTVSPCARITNAGAVTGIILPAGRYNGDTVVLVNISANSFTFAAAGTSRVADGTGAVIAALTQKTFVWSSTDSLWYHN